MNIADAKSMPLDELLLKLGYLPVKQQGGRLWYRSPFREERTASFVLSKDGAAWYDHGEGVGGNIIDLAMRLGDCRDVPQALSWLDDTTGHMAMTIPTIRQRLPVTPAEPAYRLISAKPFTVRNRPNWYTPAAAYLKSQRGIDPEAFAPYLSDLTYAGKDGKKRYGFGMQCTKDPATYAARRSGDFEKANIGHSGFTAWPAIEGDAETAPWKTFYGMMDFGTFLTQMKIKGQSVRQFNYLVIHGDAMAAAARDFLQTRTVTDMQHYRDNDESGSGYRAMLIVMEGCSDATGGDMAHLYEPHKDLNEWWQDQLGITRPAPQIAPQARPETGLKNTPKI